MNVICKNMSIKHTKYSMPYYILHVYMWHTSIFYMLYNLYLNMLHNGYDVCDIYINRIKDTK